MNFWPRTLVVQLIAVTALAVLASNIGVAIWFEQGTMRESEDALNERALDRAASVAITLGAVPAEIRPVVLRTMSTHFWRFEMIPDAELGAPMSDEETRLTAHLSALLPPGHPRGTIAVHLRSLPPQTKHRSHGLHRDEGAGPDFAPSVDSVESIVPVDANTELRATFMRPPRPWPLEILYAAIAAILVVSAAAAVIARRVARPLSELAAAASVVAHGGSAPHLRERGPDDVRNASIAFNRMTETVTRTLESQRQLLSAVGHDLRTPITAMRINLEFVEDPEMRERLFRNLDELQVLTESVLSAARGAGGETKRNVDLSALVESLCADLDEIGEPVTCHPLPPAPLSCRPNEIRRAVRNLVENAVAYGHKAEVALNETPSGYEIVVDDAGPGIPENDRQRVFEPFVRLETSRNEETGGTGLGLTLVKAITEGHGGAIILENRDEGGLRARMQLPRVNA
jgi:signal transduction histidine kinase